jgi:hypothetical protein
MPRDSAARTLLLMCYGPAINGATCPPRQPMAFNLAPRSMRAHEEQSELALAPWLCSRSLHAVSNDHFAVELPGEQKSGKKF